MKIKLLTLDYWKNVLSQPTPFRYFVARLLIRTGIGSFIKFDAGGYLLFLFPTAITHNIYLNPKEYRYEMLPYLNSGDVVVDVGANIGSTAIPSAKKVGDAGKVFAFELNPQIFLYLERNIKLNQLNNISAFNCGIGNKTGSCKTTNLENDVLNRIDDNSKGETVKIAPLDSFLGEVDIIHLLKIDTEGFELNVLQGAQETLKKTLCINIELSEHHLQRYGNSCQDVLSLLNQFGFRCFRFDEGKLAEEISPAYKQIVEYESIIATKDLDLIKQLQ